jgi:hypothetical protein
MRDAGLIQKERRRTGLIGKASLRKPLIAGTSEDVGCRAEVEGVSRSTSTSMPSMRGAGSSQNAGVRSTDGEIVATRACHGWARHTQTPAAIAMRPRSNTLTPPSLGRLPLASSSSVTRVKASIRCAPSTDRPSFDAGTQLHLVADDTVGEAVLGAKIAHDHRTGVDARRRGRPIFFHSSIRAILCTPVASAVRQACSACWSSSMGAPKKASRLATIREAGLSQKERVRSDGARRPADGGDAATCSYRCVPRCMFPVPATLTRPQKARPSSVNRSYELIKHAPIPLGEDTHAARPARGVSSAWPRCRSQTPVSGHEAFSRFHEERLVAGAGAAQSSPEQL